MSALRTVLVVDDEDAVRRFVKRVLMAEGYSVLEAGSGAEAMRICRNHAGPIDVLVTDLVMRSMGGRTLAAAVVGLRPKVKVIFMSGSADDGDDEAPAGSRFLSKPFPTSALIDMLREATKE